MYCYLLRHGQDDETVRGGWNNLPLTKTGIEQAQKLAEEMSRLSIGSVYSSDLCRSQQTAEIIANKLHLHIIPLPQFREVNNGVLAGMDNSLARKRFPDLFWNQMGWEQCYPQGESPKQFWERICSAWATFSEQIRNNDQNVVLVTHGGVIQVILSILEDRQYSNREVHRNVRHAEMIVLSDHSGAWEEICREKQEEKHGTEILRSL